MYFTPKRGRQSAVTGLNRAIQVKKIQLWEKVCGLFGKTGAYCQALAKVRCAAN